MLLDHYGLSEPPFGLTPHTEFFFSGGERGPILDALLYAIDHEDGIVQVAGEVGTGKTMLARMLLERLPPSVQAIYLANPSLGRDDMLSVLATELQVEPASERTVARIRGIEERLVELYAAGRRILLIIDEAHTMPADTLELAMRVTVQGVAVDRRLARQVVYGEMAQKIGPGFRIGPDSLLFREGEVTGIDDEGRVTFVMQGAGDVSATVDESAVQRLVRGIPAEEAMRRLESELVLTAPPTVELWPRFWPLKPALPLRISVEVEGQS